MGKKNKDTYTHCVELMRELINEWEKIRPDEEVVIMVLPKYNQKARRDRLEEISRMVLREEW